MSAPQAITGVTRPEPLRELSMLLGVAVTDVRRARVYRGNPQPDDNAWRLTVAGREPDDWPVLSRQFRTPWWLNTLILRWGRDPNLPPLTARDGRRCLRLMHEHIESKTDTSTEGMKH